MPTPKCAIIVDHPLRDLPACVLTGIELTKKGIDVYLVPFNLQDFEIPNIGPDFVLLNYFRKNIQPFISKLIDLDIDFGFMDNEGGLYGDMNKYLTSMILEPEICHKVKLNAVWGKETLRYVEKYFPNCCVLTGLPRYDFYSEIFRENEAGRLSSDWRDKKFTLFNTKVAVTNPNFLTRQQELDLYVKSLGMDLETVLEYEKVGKETINETVKLMKHLSSRYQNENYVLRSHPHEKESTYSEPLEGINNVFCSKEGVVGKWILNSKAVLHRECTTAIEAALAGIPAISPQWIPTSANAPDTEKVSLRPQSLDEFNEIMDAIYDGSFTLDDSISREIKSLEEKWFTSVDGKSHVRLADAIENVISLKNTNKDKLKKYYSFKNNSSKVQLKRKVKRFLVSNRNAAIIKDLKTLRQLKAKLFSRNDVGEIINSLESAADVKNIKISTPEELLFSKKSESILMSRA